jgi:hypothetical protein
MGQWMGCQRALEKFNRFSKSGTNRPFTNLDYTIPMPRLHEEPSLSGVQSAILAALLLLVIAISTVFLGEHPTQASTTRTRAPQPGDYWAGCNEARAAGTAPIYANEPGYREDMDGDGDGIACESVPQ